MSEREPAAPAVTVAVPTYGRHQVLVDTVERLLRQRAHVAEFLIVDQTARHDPATEERLRRWEAEGSIRRIFQATPSIPRAMNTALREARCPIVLFLDDDVVPLEGLIAAHMASYRDTEAWAVTGQVLQPDETPRDTLDYGATTGMRAYLDFPFNSTREAWVANVMGGNLSVHRERAIALGGFDENFIGVAFRFETEFARRVIAHGGCILFQPRASIRHLRAQVGGSRSHGNHLTSASPLHGVGDYYFALRNGLCFESVRYVLNRPVREVGTRFHLRHPWWIPVKLVGEACALLLAAGLVWRGPRLLNGAAHR